MYVKLCAALGPQRIYNPNYGNGAPAMFTSYYYLKLTLPKTPLP